MLRSSYASEPNRSAILPRVRRSRCKAALFETMEKRELMSATFSVSNHILTITADPYLYQGLDVNATAGGSNLQVTTSSNGTHTYDVVLKNISTAGLQKIIFNGTSHGDTFTIEPSVNIPAVIYGGNGGDYLQGGSGADSIYGGSGDDVLIGGAGADLMVGSAGNDYFDAMDGNTTDKVYGGETDGLPSGTDTADVDQRSMPFYIKGHVYSLLLSDVVKGVGTVHKWTA